MEGKMSLILLALCLLGQFAIGEAAREIVILGDSLSDNGNGVAATDRLVLQTTSTYPQLPYYSGRWSDGPVWIEFAAKSLGSNLTDFASAGATSGTTPAVLPPLPVGFANLTVATYIPSNNLFQQEDQLLLKTKSVIKPGPVYIIFIGGNDLFSVIFENTSVTAQAIADNVEKVTNNLYKRGARDFIFGLIPPLGALPVFNHPTLYGNFSASAIANINQEAADYNTIIQQFANNYNVTHPGSTAVTYDWGGALVKVLTNAGAYGLTNLADACYIEPYVPQYPAPSNYPIGRAGGTECSDPGSYAFWDQLHPSTIVHQGIGADFVNTFGKSIFGESIYIPAPPPAGTPAATGASSSPPAKSAVSPPPPAKSTVSPPIPTPTSRATTRASVLPPPPATKGPMSG